MKKTLAILLAVVMIFSLSSCIRRIDRDEDTGEPIVVRFEDLSLEEQLQMKAGESREYVSSTDNGKIAPAKDPQTGMYGYINIYGDWVINPQYEYAYCFNEDNAPIIDGYHEYEYINRDGSVLMSEYTRKVGFKASKHFYNFFTAFTIDSGYDQTKIYIASDGISQITAAKLPQTSGVKYQNKNFFMAATPFKNENAVAMRKTNAALLEEKGNTRAKLESKELYQSAYVLDQIGEVVGMLPAGLDIFDYSLNNNGTVIVRDMTNEDMLYGVCDLDGNIIIPCYYNLIEYCDNGLYLASDSTGFFGYLDRQGNIAIEFKYVAAYPFSCGLAAVKEGDSWGFIDTRGTYLIESKWDEVAKLYYPDFDVNMGGSAFLDNVAAVRYGDFWALIDDKANIIDAVYAPAGSCPYVCGLNGIISFAEYKDGTTTGKYGLMNTKGELLLEANFDAIGIMN